MYKKKIMIGLVLALSLLIVKGTAIVLGAAPSEVRKVQIGSSDNGYQLNIRLLNNSSVTSINIGTQNPFGGMPHEVVAPSSVRKRSDGTWAAALGSQIPRTLTIYRRLWILPIQSSGQSSTFKWEDGDFNITYKVEPGDTLFRIAKAFNLPLAKVIAANTQFHNPDRIYPDDEVDIPHIQPIPPRYEVHAGDTLYGISKKFNLSLGRVIKANPQIKNPDLIVVGQTVTLPQQFY